MSLPSASSSDGQAAVVVIVLVALAACLGFVALAAARLTIERARLQRVADGAALAGALALARHPFDTAGALRAARAAIGGRLGSSRVEVLTGVVSVHIAGPLERIPLPGLLGGGGVGVAPAALGRAVPGPPPLALVAGAAVGELSRVPLPADVPAALRPLIAAAGAREAVPPALLAAQEWAESGYDPAVVSSAGAEGIAQFLPGTWSEAWNPWRAQSPFDPSAAIPAQARYLAALLRHTSGDVVRALAAYNAGEGVLARPAAAWPAETRAYVPRVLGHLGIGLDALPAAFPEQEGGAWPTAHLVA